MIKFLKDKKADLIVASLFLIFVQPILEFCSRLFVRFSELVGAAYFDRIYQQVAHLETQDYSLLVVVFLVGVPALKNSLASLAKILNIEATVPQVTVKKEGVSRYVVAFALIICLSLLMSILISNFIQLSTISSFKQHMRIISPYITAQEEKELLSQWSLINSKRDFQAIYIKIESIAKNKGIVLPENKIYSLLSI